MKYDIYMTQTSRQAYSGYSTYRGIIPGTKKKMFDFSGFENYSYEGRYTQEEADAKFGQVYYY